MHTAQRVDRDFLVTNATGHAELLSAPRRCGGSFDFVKCASGKRTWTTAGLEKLQRLGLWDGTASGQRPPPVEDVIFPDQTTNK